MSTRTNLLFLLLSLALLPAAARSQESAHWSLDAVLDTRAQQSEGIPVLAVTPGGAAERMGLVAGDRIVSINGASLTGGGSPQQALDAALLDSKGSATLVVTRAGSPTTLGGTLGGASTQAATSGCGFVTANDPTPVVSEMIFPAEITQIDGHSTPLVPQNRFQLPAGQHVLVVRELIPSMYFNSGELRHRRLMQQQQLGKAYKALVVNVAPGTRYQVGARLLKDRMGNENMRDNAYWEPVMYGTRAEACR